MTTTKTPKQILIEAKALIDTPEKWVQGRTSVMYDNVLCRCALAAIWDMGGRARAENILRKVIHDKSIANWNDAPNRTHAEIMAGFDAAIELAGSQEAQGICIGRGSDGCGYRGGKSGDTCPQCGGMLLSQQHITIADNAQHQWEESERP